MKQIFKTNLRNIGSFSPHLAFVDSQELIVSFAKIYKSLNQSPDIRESAS